MEGSGRLDVVIIKLLFKSGCLDIDVIIALEGEIGVKEYKYFAVCKQYTEASPAGAVAGLILGTNT